MKALQKEIKDTNKANVQLESTDAMASGDFDVTKQNIVEKIVSNTNSENKTKSLSSVESVLNSDPLRRAGPNRFRLFSATCTLTVASNENKDQTISLASLICQIPNALPWIYHLICNRNVIATIQEAYRYTANFFDCESGEGFSCRLDPQAYFVTSEKYDFTIVALSHDNLALLQQKRPGLTLSSVYPDIGAHLGCLRLLEGSCLFVYSRFL